MAKPDRRSTEQDTDAEDGAADATVDATTDAGSSDGEVSQTGGLSTDVAGDSDAPDDGPHAESSLDDADPRSSATAGNPVDPDTADDADADADADVVPARGKAGTSDRAAARGEGKGTGKASRSGNPARKSGAGKGTDKRRVGRTPVKPKVIGNRWAAPAMLASAGIGLAWIVVFYVTQDRIEIPWYSDLGSWNLIIGMGFIVAAFGFSMKWE